MKRADIADAHVVGLAAAWSNGDSSVGVVEALIREGIPAKLAVSKVEHLCDRGLLNYGVSVNYAWPELPRHAAEVAGG